MLEVPLRHAATLLLEYAIRIAPPDTREWGQAMRGELSYVDGQWAALAWAFGGARTMVKYALISILVPGRGQGIPPGDELFAKSVSLGKAALVGGAGCVLAALLFFGAPPFRQAFRVALKPWHFMFQRASWNYQPGFDTLAKRAEMQHDSEGLAFCAVRLENPGQSARLAEEAVRLNPNLIWVFAVVGMRHPGLPEVSQWLEKLERWDPQNSLFHLIASESIDRSHFHGPVWMPSTQEQEQAWQSAMTAAFHSPQFDDYLDRVAELARRVIPRYGFYDPYEVESREQLDLPQDTLESCGQFASSLLRSGQALDTTGDRKGAREIYWTVARFGQIVDSQGRTRFERLIGTSLQALAYKQLQASFAREGNQKESALFGYLSAKFDPIQGEHPGFPPESAFGLDTARRNAAVVQISGLMIVVFSGLLVIAAAILVLGGSVSGRARPAAQRAKPVATMVLVSSAAGLLFSSVTLYLTYRPYWYIFQGAVLNGGRSQARDLIYFLNETKMPPGISPRAYLVMHSLLYSGSPNLLFYVWTGVTLLGLVGLALILLRHILSRPPVNKLQNHPKVP